VAFLILFCPQEMNFTGQPVKALAINGRLPGFAMWPPRSNQEY
jgi:hypothetical protein